MVDKKRKTRQETRLKNDKGHKKIKKSKSMTLNNESAGRNNGEWRKNKGPRLPNSLRMELDHMNPTEYQESDQEIESDEANDVYEYEEEIAEEESKKNRRFDPVDNYEYELPKNFEDENVASDEDEDEDNVHNSDGDSEGDDTGEKDDARHARMLENITGLPCDIFKGKKKSNTLLFEAYPESEYNPTSDVLHGNGQITIEDLLEPLHGKPGFSKLRKSVHRMVKHSASIQAPLPKPDQEKLERKAAYELSKKDISKWEPLVKRNREAPTIFFDEDMDLGFSTVGAIASEFEPRTGFEKKIASLVNDNEILEAHRKDGARLLELNKISVEDVKDHQNRLAKMRTLLFRHEIKAKRIKKIKSKTYRRLLKKDRSKMSAAEMELDPKAAKELAMKQEFKRAEERMTLKHKNSSKWAKRILKRGLTVQDDGTRAAIADQLHQHVLLTRKMNSMKDSSSSDDMSDEDDIDEVSAGSDQDGASKLLEKAKEKTLEVLTESDEVPTSGVLALPFMVRGLKRRKEAADEEAKHALEEYESSLKQLEDSSEAKVSKISTSSGRRVFGAPKKQVESFDDKTKQDNYYGNSDSDEGIEVKEDVAFEHDRNKYLHKDVNTDLFHAEAEIDHDTLFKSFNDVKGSGAKTTYDVAIFASNSWKKKKYLPQEYNGQMKGEDTKNFNAKGAAIHTLQDPDVQEEDVDSDTGSEGHMVDGILSSGTKTTYELPSQVELIRRAFAGDDVEEDFEKDKLEILNEENPEPEKPILLPGWGQWTHIQNKKGLPSWMLEEHKNAKKNREEALRKRKDAHLNHVVISEKLDKKAEKLQTKTLPYPYTSKDVFEQSIRMPIGPEFNPATAFRALNRPEVVKKAGVIIKPIKFEDINPHERAEDQKNRGGQKQKRSSSKIMKKRSANAITK